MNLQHLLEQVRDGELSVDDAAGRLRDLPYENLGFARLDHHRSLRTGAPETVFCSGKAAAHLVEIFRRFHADGAPVLGTRAAPEQFEAVRAALPEAVYDPISRILRLGRPAAAPVGEIAVCSGGTADLPAAEEAAQTAEFLGSRVTRIYDVGIAGIHRLFAELETLRRARCVIAAAGMEGALPGVVAGLIDRPVIALPTSVGYGTGAGGIAALLTMLNSCAEGIATVNIDNGFGAGYLANQINRLACGETR